MSTISDNNRNPGKGEITKNIGDTMSYSRGMYSCNRCSRLMIRREDMEKHVAGHRNWVNNKGKVCHKA